MNRFILCAAVALFSGCHASRIDGAVLTQLSRISSSVECPSGGVKITTGRDWNDDGQLAEDEVLQSSKVCNGATAEIGSSTLTASQTLPFGDAHCPTGGAFRLRPRLRR